MKGKIISAHGWRIEVRAMTLRDSIALQAWLRRAEQSIREEEGAGNPVPEEGAGIMYVVGVCSACGRVVEAPEGEGEEILWDVELFLNLPVDLVDEWLRAALELNPRLDPKNALRKISSTGTKSSDDESMRSSSRGSRKIRRPQGP